MGADRIAAIRPALNELLHASENDEPGAANLCATFTVPDQPDIWMQVQLGTINAFYPHTEEPLAFLRSADIPALPGLALDDWQPKLYATFVHDHCPLHSLAQFIDQLLIALHGLPAEDDSVDVTFERLQA